MKKSKVILAVVLAVVILVTCMNVPTFSTWFSRIDKILLGEDLNLSLSSVDVPAGYVGSDYKAYNGVLNGQTPISTMISPNGDPDNYTVQLDSYSGSGIPPHSRKYFCTTITNSSGVDQNVSLFADYLRIPSDASNGKLALGVNGPTRSYRDYSSLAVQAFKTERDRMRIYFQKDDGVNKWGGTDFYVVWGSWPGDANSYHLGDGNGAEYYYLYHGTCNRDDTYYADIPSYATNAFFCVKDWDEAWKRTGEITNLGNYLDQLNSHGFGIKDENNGSGNPKLKDYYVDGANIKTYYSSITLANHGTYNAGLVSGEFIGNISYWSGNTSVFTVNQSTGEITAQGPGEAKLYTKVTGVSFADELEVETTVKVTAGNYYEWEDVPIVRNLRIPGDTTDGKNVVKVYWYVYNNSDTNNLSYNIGNIYLGV